MSSIVYMAVSKDKYHLPIAVADTARELARLTGVKTETIYSEIARFKSGKLHGQRNQRFFRIELEDEDVRC